MKSFKGHYDEYGDYIGVGVVGVVVGGDDDWVGVQGAGFDDV